MFTHIYLRCSMESEQYEYENSLGEDYSKDKEVEESGAYNSEYASQYYDEWYDQSKKDEKWDDFNDMEESAEDDAEDWYFGEDKD